MSFSNQYGFCNVVAQQYPFTIEPQQLNQQFVWYPQQYTLPIQHQPMYQYVQYQYSYTVFNPQVDVDFNNKKYEFKIFGIKISREKNTCQDFRFKE